MLPTTSVGMLIPQDGTLLYSGTLSAFQVIAQSGSPIVNVSFYRVPQPMNLPARERVLSAIPIGDRNAIPIGEIAARLRCTPADIARGLDALIDRRCARRSAPSVRSPCSGVPFWRSFGIWLK